MAIKPGHDGAVAVVKDRQLLYCLESEKDSYPRHSQVTPTTLFNMTERLGEMPDVIAVGGWSKEAFIGKVEIEAGYLGSDVVSLRDTTFCGQPVKMFSSSHVRSHIAMAGMAPRDDASLRAVLVWEGAEGTFFLLDEHWAVVREIPVLQFLGGRYAATYAIAAEWYPDSLYIPDGDDSGKLMALAAYAHPADADASVRGFVDRILSPDEYPDVKGAFRDTPLYNVGVEADVTKAAAALLQERIFEIFARAALQELPRDIPLFISGGCGLNCEWNMKWRELGHFSSVFVPPCASDSGSAVGTAQDALLTMTGDPWIDWNVYCGLEFEWDTDPDPATWKRRALDNASLADALAAGRVVGWVQGRWELGPRALGNRSLLAEPFQSRTTDRLNDIKMREAYRPIAPVCRIEDAGKVFSADFHDPYMLYFRMVTSPDLKAVTHVDGSARVQTVTKDDNKPLHDLLSAFGERHGVGVLCNTSLNYKRLGFINRMSDLCHYCETRGVDDMVVGDVWFERVEQ